MKNLRKSYESPEFDMVKISFESMLAQIRDSDTPDPRTDGDDVNDD